MFIGYPNHPRRDIKEEIQWAFANGFDFIDLFVEPDRAALEEIDVPTVGDLLSGFKHQATGHLAYYLPIGSPMKQLREAAVDITVQHLDTLSKLNINVVTIHGNWPPRLFTVEEGIRWQVESLQTMAEAAAARGMAMMYEHVPTAASTQDVVAEILHAVPDLRFHLDIGHAFIQDNAPAQWIRRFADRLAHVHLHDNNGTADQHLPAGAGHVNWPETIKALKDINYNKTISIEVFSADRDYVLMTKEKLKSWVL